MDNSRDPDIEWTHDSVIRLVEEYKKHPELWDSSNELYRTYTAKYTAWCELGETFGCDIADLRKKINSILASHRREKMRVRCGGRSMWFLYNKLSFLPHHLENNDQIVESVMSSSHQEASNQQSSDDNMQQDGDEDDEEEDIHEIVIKEEPLVKVYSKPKLKYHKPRLTRKRNLIKASPPSTSGPTKVTKLDNKILETLKLIRRSNLSRQKDECDSFGEYIADSLRKHDDRTQAMIKQAINNILFEQEMKKYTSGHYEVVLTGVDENPLILSDNHNDK